MRLQLVSWTLRRRPWRNLLIAMSVAITVAVLTVFFAARFEISRFLSRIDDIPYQRIWIKPRNLSTRITYPLALTDQLAKVPGVRNVFHILRVNAKTPDGQGLFCDATSPGLPVIDRDLFPNDDAMVAAWDKEPTGAFVASGFAELLNAHVGDERELKTAAGPVKIKIAAISQGAYFPKHCFLHYKYVDELFGAKGQVSDFRLAMDRGTDPKPVIDGLDKVLATNGFAAQAVNEQTMMQISGVSGTSLIPNLLGALGVFLLLTTGIAIANATMISVRERRSELATLRVIGFKRGSVAGMILSESIVVCLVGGVLGAALAWFVMRNGISLGTIILPAVHLTRAGLLAGLTVSLVIPVIGSSFAAWLAVRAPLAAALRDAG